MTQIRIYLEGGGDGANGRAQLRRGFDEFLREIKDKARQRRLHWQTIACGSRNDAYDAFMNARVDHPHAINLLVVDSEDPVKAATVRDHLQERDQWDLSDVAEDRCYLMAQVMEAWFIADKDALVRYYKQDFRAKQIPEAKNVETISKARIFSALEGASAKTSKGKYHKIQHASELLGEIDPTKVRQAAPRCDSFLLFLEAIVKS